MRKKLFYVPWNFVWMPIIAVLLILWSASIELPAPVIWAAVLVAAAALVLDLWPKKSDRDRLEARLVWLTCFPVYYSSILACVILLLGGTDPEQTQIFALTIALIGVAGSLIAHSLSGNKRLKNIEGIATTAPDRLDQSIQNTGKEICRTINAQDEKLLRDVLEIKSSTASVQRQMENLHLHQEGVPVQMDQMIGYINRLYLCHDRDQKKIQSLKAENEKLRKRNRELEDQLSLCRGDDCEYGD